MCLKPGPRQLQHTCWDEGKGPRSTSIVAKLVNWKPGAASDQFSPFEGKANDTVCVQDSHRDVMHSIMNINHNIVQKL